MSSIESPKILVVGAGPSGLIAALTLIRNGVPVRIIEKSTTPRIGQRGAGVMARTFEVFEALGFLEEAMKYTIDVPKMRMYKPGSSTEVAREFFLHHVVDPTPDRPYINPRLLGQESLDKVLRELLEKLGCHIELGVELVSLEQNDEKVKVKLQKTSGGQEEEASYDYVIGADGARGVVRKQLGLTFVGETTEQKMAVGEFMVEGGLESDIWHRWGEPGTYMLMIRPTDQPGLFTFVTGGRLLPNPTDVVQSETVLKEYIKERLAGRDVKIGDIRWMGTYTINIRMVDSFKKGRVLVTGDAAHVHSPTGAQGMNTGIQDSYNIGWKLALVQKGVAPPSLLETVTEERVPVVAEMLELTTTLLKRTILSDADRNRPEAVNQYGVNYRLSSIVLDDGTDLEEARKISPYGGGDARVVYAGDRAPDAPGLVKIGGTQEATRLFKLFGPSHHTVLVFADKAEGVFHPSSTVLNKYPSDLVRFVVIHAEGKASHHANGPAEAFEDSQGHAYNAYKNSQNVSGAFVIRPDGFVGGRFSGIDNVETYFKGIFGDRF